MRLANVQVALRLKEGSNIIGHLPASRASVDLLTSNTIAVNAEDSTQTHEFEVCIESPEEAMFCAKANLPRLLQNLFQGISCSVIGLGTEMDKVGSFSKLLEHTLLMLNGKIIEQQEAQIEMSYMMFGVSDTSCIDLMTYQRKELEELRELTDGWIPFTQVDNSNMIIESLRQGYSLPCVIMIRLVVRSGDATLPGAMSTLLLADLGSTSPGSQLEKSFAHLRSLILTMDQTVISQDFASQPSYLSALLDRSFGGPTMTLVVADVPRTGIARNINGFIQLLASMRRVKNHPTPLMESMEMKELAVLVDAHNRLEVEHRAVRRELKQLKKALHVAELQREELIAEQEEGLMRGDISQWQHEYELSCINMEKLQVRERIRQCEIDLVCMEHERLLLLAEMDLKQRQLSELEERLRSSTEEKAKIEKEFKSEIDGLTGRLDAVQVKLQSAEKQKESLQVGLSTATAKVTSLEARIAEIEKAKVTVEKRSADDTGLLKERTKELEQLKSELKNAKSSEAAVLKKLAKVEEDAETFQSTVKELETKLSAMKLENVSLHAKLEVLSKKPQSPEISRTIKAMEDKWQQERVAMQTVMDDLRSLIRQREELSTHDNAPKKSKIAPIKPPVKPAARGRRTETIVKQLSSAPSSDEHQEDEKELPVAGPKVEKVEINPTTSVKRGRGRPKKKEVEMQKIEPIQPSGPVKLAKVKSTSPPPLNDKPLARIYESGKVEEDEGEVVIPGTPQKDPSPLTTASPSKVWKPSAFIPGVVRKPSSSTEGRNGTSGILAGLSFAQTDEAARKRIKLPERAKGGGLTEAVSISQTRERRVDPTVYSTILSSFNVPVGKK